MNELTNPVIDFTVQCWGCGVLDRMFQVVSAGAGAIYERGVFLCAGLFFALFSFYVANAIWKNLKGNGDDPFYQKSIKPVLINALVVFSLLGLGTSFPRFITMITFEPAAELTLGYTQALTHLTDADIDTRVDYSTQPMTDDGFYRPQLRDTVIQIMKLSTTQFQAYVKLGVALIDNALSLKMLTGVGALIRHILMILLGGYITWMFFKLFATYCFYFADIIVQITLFAFFFPLSLTLTAFKGTDAPGWLSGLGSGLGPKQIKRVIGSIVSLIAVVVTYTVLMAVASKFFAASGISTQELMQEITTGTVYSSDLSSDHLATLTLVGCGAMLYILRYLQKQIPQIKSMILNALGASEESQLSEQLAEQANNLRKSAWKQIQKYRGKGA